MENVKKDDRVIVVYKDENVCIELGRILSGGSMTTDEALDILGIDLDEWGQEQGWDGVDYEAVDFKYAE